jgi:RloB-like protein
VRDNQPKHRQLRRAGRRLERKRATRAGLPAILIVCEGKETEPNYLLGLCDAHGINRANVTVIPGDEETDAVRLVQKARRRFETDRDFDAVFVICDCAGEDLTHARRQAAKPMKNVSGQVLAVEMIVSRPCFEFWLVLHFEYAVRPFPTAASVIELLRRHVTDYAKADRQIFAKVQAGLDRALGNAARLKTELAAVNADSPDTDMPSLVQRLMSLRRRDLDYSR